MAKVRVVKVREETPAEAARREWFEKAALASPDSLESAARLLIGLVSGLLGVLFGALTVASDKLPNYMQSPPVRWLGVATVVLLLAGLVAALRVVLPARIAISSARLNSQAQAFEALLGRKSQALTVAVFCFGAGVITLGVVLVIALLSVA